MILILFCQMWSCLTSRNKNMFFICYFFFNNYEASEEVQKICSFLLELFQGSIMNLHWSLHKLMVSQMLYCVYQNTLRFITSILNDLCFSNIYIYKKKRNKQKLKMVYKLGWYIIKSSEKHFELSRIWSPYQLSS